MRLALGKLFKLYSKMENPLEDKRSFARFLVSLPLRFLHKFSNLEGEGQTKDISPKGIGMMTREELKPHTHLELWLHMPDNGDPLYTQGEVVWSTMIEPNKYRVGIELTKIDLMAMSRILRTMHPQQV